MLRVLFGLILIASNSFYDFSLPSINNEPIDFAAFTGKKVLIVNTASGSKYSSQFAELEKLYQRFADSLVVIAVPSNSFNDEPLSNAQIKSFLKSDYHAHYIVSSKLQVAGSEQHALYQWLIDAQKNGYMSSKLKGSFQKYLINEEGRLVGVFAPSVSPISDEMINAIQGN